MSAFNDPTELRAALIGSNISYSISPHVHAALFPILREKVANSFDSLVYDVIDLPSWPLVLNWISEARTAGMLGANVTWPYKTAAAESLRFVNREARQVRAVNTLLFVDRVESVITDGAGFRNAASRHMEDLLTPPHLVVLGAGAAARTVANTLHITHAFESITFLTRNPARTQLPRGMVATVCAFEVYRRPEASVFVLQATPVGMRSGEIVYRFPWERGDVAADMVYRPLDTAFLQQARQCGASTLDGLGMLIEQAALSQMYWMTRRLQCTSPLTQQEFEGLHHSMRIHLTE